MLIVFLFSQTLWIETTQEDFVDGIYERNIYSSRRAGGAVEFVPYFDFNNDGYIDLISSDVTGPYITIFWGSSSGYTPGRVRRYATTGASNCDAADLNGDGYPELIVGHRATPKISIYWGTPQGPDSASHQDFTSLVFGRDAVFAADCNKDGYLDIVTTQTYVLNHGAIFWGDAGGYTLENRTDLPLPVGGRNIEIADLNRDTYLDLLLTRYDGSNPAENRIFWGSDTGYLTYSVLTGCRGNMGNSIADLNNDGYIDLVFAGWYDPQSIIYWGNDNGYSPSNTQILSPGYCYGGSSVADMNGDTYLDIVYHRGGYGPAQQRIYWGSDSGYSDNNVSCVGLSLETTGGFIADLNGDRVLDLFCHVITPGTQSYLFWGPSYSSYLSLPVNDDHAAMFREIGHVYNRKYYEDYISSVHDANGMVNWGTVEWYDSLSPGSSTEMYVRTGNTPTPDTSWSTWLFCAHGDTIPDSLDSRFVQYKVLLCYCNPAYFPCLYEVRIAYESPGIQQLSDEPVPSITVLPNPFCTHSDISYNVSYPGQIAIEIFDVTGRKINTLVDRFHHPGDYVIRWCGTDHHNQQLPHGTYFVLVKRQSTTNVIRVLFIRS